MRFEAESPKKREIESLVSEINSLDYVVQLNIQSASLARDIMVQKAERLLQVTKSLQQSKKPTKPNKFATSPR